jgi:hypothetical protein
MSNNAMIITTDVDRLIAWLDATEAHHETANWHAPLPTGAAALVRQMRDCMAHEAASLQDFSHETNGLVSRVMHVAAARLAAGSTGKATDAFSGARL